MEYKAYYIAWRRSTRMLPILAQGANTAIGDAHAIARALSERVTVEEALQQYENERYPITTAIQIESQQWDKLFDVVT